MSSINNLSNIQLNIPTLPDGRVKDFLGDLTNPQTNTFKIFVIVASVLLILFISITFYRIYKENQRKPRFFKNGKDAKIQIIINNSQIQSTEPEFAYTSWLYINGLENRGSSSATLSILGEITNVVQNTISASSTASNYMEQCPAPTQTQNNNTNVSNYIEFNSNNVNRVNNTVSQNNRRGQWKHIFTKGVPRNVGSPEQCPGLWIHPNRNALRLCIKTKDRLENIDIDNIPIKKWFHIAISVNNTIVEIYLDGLLIITKALSSIPLQNSGDLVVNNIGGFEGAISQLQYFPNTLNVSKVMSIYNSGPYGGSRIERIWNSITFKTWRLKRQIKSLN